MQLTWKILPNDTLKHCVPDVAPNIVNGVKSLCGRSVYRQDDYIIEVPELPLERCPKCMKKVKETVSKGREINVSDEIHNLAWSNTGMGASSIGRSMVHCEQSHKYMQQCLIKAQRANDTGERVRWIQEAERATEDMRQVLRGGLIATKMERKMKG